MGVTMLILASIACSSPDTASATESLAARFGFDLSPETSARGTTSSSSWDGFGDTAAAEWDTGVTAPAAKVDGDASGTVGDELTFDGSTSNDPNDEELTFEWTLVAVPGDSHLTTGDLAGRYTSAAILTPDAEGHYAVQLVVTNASGESSQPFGVGASVAAADNSAPVADAGEDRTIPYGHYATLLGIDSSDADGDTLSYAWSFVSIPASSALTAADLVDSSTDHGAFEPDVEGDYEVQLEVDDGSESATDSIIITMEPGSANSEPYVDVGPPVFAELGDTVTVDASASFDPDGDTITGFTCNIQTRPIDSAISDSDLTAVDGGWTFEPDATGDYVVVVEADDGTDVGSAELDINVVDSGGPGDPVASAGVYQEAPLGTEIALYSGSYHPAGDTLTLAWSFVSVPSASSLTDADLSDTTADEPTFSPDVAGEYDISLQVTDPDGDTASDGVVIEIQ